jgi:hypothetical protein
MVKTLHALTLEAWDLKLRGHDRRFLEHLNLSRLEARATILGTWSLEFGD